MGVCLRVQLVASNWLSIRLETMGAVVTGCSAGVAVYFAQTVSPGLVGLGLAYALGVAGFLNFIIHTIIDLEFSSLSHLLSNACIA